MPHQLRYLYGGDRPWDSSLWETSDDRVRGGSSVSHLTALGPHRARFHGNLDTTTLGGAGFASQHSAGELSLDLSGYDGLLLVVSRADQHPTKRFALTLKDALRPRRDDGRERSSVSYQAEFTPEGPGEVFLPWSAFKATYRGRDRDDVPPLDLTDVKRVGLMMRSFFGDQQGDFSLELRAIAARKNVDDDDDDEYDDLKKPIKMETKKGGSGWRSLFCGML